MRRAEPLAHQPLDQEALLVGGAVARQGAGPRARALASEARWPLLAEPSSGCRTGDSVVRTYRLLLESMSEVETTPRELPRAAFDITPANTGVPDAVSVL